MCYVMRDVRMPGSSEESFSLRHEPGCCRQATRTVRVWCGRHRCLDPHWTGLLHRVLGASAASLGVCSPPWLWPLGVCSLLLLWPLGSLALPVCGRREFAALPVCSPPLLWPLFAELQGMRLHHSLDRAISYNTEWLHKQHDYYEWSKFNIAVCLSWFSTVIRPSASIQ